MTGQGGKTRTDYGATARTGNEATARELRI